MQYQTRFNRPLTLLVAVALTLLLIGPGASAQAPAGTASQTALGTSIPYQGQLNDNGAPANGTYDFQFKLYDDASAGNPIGSAVNPEDVLVTNGLFAVTLDFGSNVFNGNERFLEIGVRPGASTGAYTTLSPRRPLLAVPYAHYSNATRGLSVDGNGKVGIGTDVPANQLHVVVPASSAAEAALFESARGDYAGIRFRPLVTGADKSANDVALNTLPNGGFAIFTYATPGQNGDWRLSILRGGNVGINTTTPTHRLHVVGVGAQEAAVFESAENRDYAGIRLRPGGTPTDETANEVALNTLPNGGFGIFTYATPGQNGDWRLSILRGGNVGIHTTTPTHRLHVVGVGAQEAAVFESAEDRDYAGIRLRPGGTPTDETANEVALNTLPNGGFGIFTYATPGQNGDWRLSVLRDGKVGIGTTAPQTTLDVNGTTTTKVLQIMGGSDLAEPFEIAGTYEIQPGMVVAIDADNPGQLRLADTAYDRTVAGVVSGAGGINPGLILQQEGSVAAGEHPVALTGRVYVYADATNGPITPGDLLTTADTPGHAMKVTDHDRAQGAILGKAMSKLEEGTGLVLMLVTLQ